MDSTGGEGNKSPEEIEEEVNKLMMDFAKKESGGKSHIIVKFRRTANHKPSLGTDA